MKWQTIHRWWVRIGGAALAVFLAWNLIAWARENAARLPPGTEWVLIRGGNHSQFGHYGFQFGDRFAAISRGRQQSELVAAVVHALRSGDLSAASRFGAATRQAAPTRSAVSMPLRP